MKWRSIAMVLVTVAGCRGPEDKGISLVEQPAADFNANDPVGGSSAPARKGAGGVNGDGDYCDNANCVAMEGDCDSNAQCTGGSVCLADNGGRYAAFPGGTAAPRNNQQDDHCAPATCNDRIAANTPGETGKDCGGPCGSCDPALVSVPGGLGDGTACELAQHHADACTYHCQCAVGSGDCDANDNCMGWDDPNPSLRALCVADQGNRFGGPVTSDYCMPAHCTNRVQDLPVENLGVDAGGPCGSPNCGNPAPGAECTPSCPCAEGGGDCDINADCQTGLLCHEEGAIDRCRSGGPPPVCTELLLSVSAQDNLLRTIDPNSGATISSVPISGAQPVVGLTALAAHPVTGQLWGVIKTGGRRTDRYLGQIDRNTGAATGLVNVGQDIAAIAVDASGVIHAVTGELGANPESLLTLNPANGARTVVCAIGRGTEGESLAFNPNDGGLYHGSGHTGAAEVIFERLGANCAGTPIDISATPLIAEEAAALAYSRRNNVFYWKQMHGPGPLFRVTTAGAATLLGQMDHKAKGLAAICL